MDFWASVELGCLEVRSEEMTGEIFCFLGRKVAADYLCHLLVDRFKSVVCFSLAYQTVGGVLLQVLVKYIRYVGCPQHYSGSEVLVTGEDNRVLCFMEMFESVLLGGGEIGPWWAAVTVLSFGDHSLFEYVEDLLQFKWACIWVPFELHIYFLDTVVQFWIASESVYKSYISSHSFHRRF